MSAGEEICVGYCAKRYVDASQNVKTMLVVGKTWSCYSNACIAYTSISRVGLQRQTESVCAIRGRDEQKDLRRQENRLGCSRNCGN